MVGKAGDQVQVPFRDPAEHLESVAIAGAEDDRRAEDRNRNGSGKFQQRRFTAQFAFPVVGNRRGIVGFGSRGGSVAWSGGG